MSLSRPVSEEGFSAFQRFTMYETAVNLIIVGCDKGRTQFRILLIDRTSLYKLEILEDPASYSKYEIITRLRVLLERGGHPLEHHFSFHGILGFIPLPKLHIILITQKTKIGSIGNRWIYGIGEWSVFPIQHRNAVERDPRRGADTPRYKQLITDYIDLTKDFYFSYYYDLTHSLQENLQSGAHCNNNTQRKHSINSNIQEITEEKFIDSLKPLERNDIVKEIDSSSNEMQQSQPMIQPHRDHINRLQIPSTFTSSIVKSTSTPTFPSRVRAATSSPSPPIDSIMSPIAGPLLSTSISPPNTNTTNILSTSHDDGSEDGEISSLTPSLRTSNLHTDESNIVLDPWADLDSTFAAAADAPIATTTSPSSSTTSVAPTSPTAKSSSPSTQSGPTSPSSRVKGTSPIPPPRSHTYNEQFLWNLYLAHIFLDKLPDSYYWMVPLIHGFFRQRLLRYKHHDLIVTLIARRSRHYAGTRYIKRGLNHQGHVANEVETEQIIEMIDNNKSTWFSTGSSFSSVVLLRGSIPLYWSQENVHTMKPNIVIEKDQENYSAAKTHFDDLYDRYGPYIDVLSLIKKEERHPQEMRLGVAYTSAMSWLRDTYEREAAMQDRKKVLEYQTYDFINMRSAKANVLRDIRNLVKKAVEQIGVYSHVHSITVDNDQDNHEEKEESKNNDNHHPVMRASDLLKREQRHIHTTCQCGIIRINCVDCLDRTNVAMFCVGKAAMKLQLQSLGMLDEQKNEKIFPELLQVLQLFFTQHGDRIAQQYAGSGAMHRDALYDKDPHGEDDDEEMKDQNDLISGGVGEATRDRLDRERALSGNQQQIGSSDQTIISSMQTAASSKSSGIAHNAISFAKRYYSNNVTDVEKTQAINVFLGHYMVATEGKKTPVWDIDPATPMLDFDLLMGDEIDDIFYIPYDPSLLGDVLIKPRGSHVTKEQRASFVANLNHRFKQFFDEKYNPTKLTSLDQELTKQYKKPTLIQGQTFIHDKQYQQNINTISTLSAPHSATTSPYLTPLSTSIPNESGAPLPLAVDEPESPMPGVRSPSSSFSATKAEAVEGQWKNTPPASPSPHSRSPPRGVYEPPSPAEPVSPRLAVQQEQPSTPTPTQTQQQQQQQEQQEDPLAVFNFTVPVNSYFHPSQKSTTVTSLAAATHAANKAAAATKRLFTKGLKSAFGGKKEKDLPAESGSMHRVRSTTNMTTTANQLVAPPALTHQLPSSRSQDFHQMDLSSASSLSTETAASTNKDRDITNAATGIVSPRKSTTTPRSSSALPPQHNGAILTSSNSFTQRVLSPTSLLPKSSSSSSLPSLLPSSSDGHLITHFDDLLSSVPPPPQYYSYESPHHQQHLEQMKLRREKESQMWTKEMEEREAEQRRKAEQQTSIIPFIKLPPTQDDQLFQSYLNTQRFGSSLHYDESIWSPEYQNKMKNQRNSDNTNTYNNTIDTSKVLTVREDDTAHTASLSLSSAPRTNDNEDHPSLVTSTIPVHVSQLSSALQNSNADWFGIDPLAQSTEVPGNTDAEAVAKLAGEIHE